MSDEIDATPVERVKYCLEAHHRIKYVDLVLFVFGFKLYAGDGIQRVFNLGLRVVCAAIFYLNLITFIVITDHREDIFLSLAFIFKYLIYIALHHYFCLQHAKLKGIFEANQELADSFDKFEPSRLTSKGFLKAWCVMTLLALLMTARVVSFDYKAYSKYEKRSQKENIVNAILTTVIMNLLLSIYNFGFLYSTFVLYAYVYHQQKELDENFFRLARTPFAEDDQTSPVVSRAADQRELLAHLRTKRTHMQSLKEKTNLYLGLLPCLWFVLIYLEVSWLIIATSFSSFTANLGEIIYRATITLYVVAIALLAEFKLHNAECRATDALLGKLATSADDAPDLAQEKMHFVTDINASPVIWPKILMLVPLNKYALFVLAGLTVPSALAIRFFG